MSRWMDKSGVDLTIPAWPRASSLQHGSAPSDSANKGSLKQAYNAQIAVDAHAQLIVAADVTQQVNDKQQLEPMAQVIVQNVGKLADVTSADAGYFSEKAIDAVNAMGTFLLVPPHRQKHGEVEPAGRARTERNAERAHAPQATHADRPSALSNAQGDRRAGLRTDQERARARSLRHPRARQRPARVSLHRDDAQRGSSSFASAGPARSQRAERPLAAPHGRTKPPEASPGDPRPPDFGWGARGERPRSPRTRPVTTEVGGLCPTNS